MDASDVKRAYNFADAIRARKYMLLAGDKEALVHAVLDLADDLQQALADIEETENERDALRRELREELQLRSTEGLRRGGEARSAPHHHQRGEVTRDFPLRLSAAGRDALRRAIEAEKGDAR